MVSLSAAGFRRRAFLAGSLSGVGISLCRPLDGLSAAAPLTEQASNSMHDPSLRLFVDDHHVRTMFGLRRVFGKLEKRPEPVLEDIPGRLAWWACVLREPDGRWRMWYQSGHAGDAHELGKAGVWGRGDEFGYFPDRHPNPIHRTQTSVISYAESDDGIFWRKPELGLIEYRGSKANNIVLDGAAAAKRYDNTLTNMDTVSVVRDDTEPDPAKRYKMVCHWEGHVWANHPTLENLGRPQAHMQKVWASRAKYLNTSPDGIHWEQVPVRIKDCAGGGDYAAITRDERNRRWWFTDRAPVGLPHVGYRSAGVCVSDDLYHWPDTVEMVFTPGAFEEYGLKYEHHGWTPFNYGDMDLCLLEYSVGGCPIAGVLGIHRDGEPWRRANGDVFFLDREPDGGFDDSLIAMTHNAPLRSGDSLLFHYNERRWQKGDEKTNPSISNMSSHIGVATLRLDGFAALSADRAFLAEARKPAMLITRAIEVREDELQVNIEGHRGTARAALLDAGMRPIPGFEAENCLPIAEDAVREPVRWTGNPSLTSLKGRPVHVFVQLAAGALYAVRL